MKSQQCRIRSKGSKQDGLQTSWVSKIDEGIELVLENGYEDLEREVGRWMWRIHDAREMGMRMLKESHKCMYDSDE